jgi:outer membrane protein OmpA-like peptidoglycan-associated protein
VTRHLALLALAALLAAPASARKKDIPFVDTRGEDAQPVGMRDPREELALILKKIERGELPKIEFEFDKDVITLESYPTLDAIVDLMTSNEQLHLKVLAHCDAIGTDEYNLDLSERRAKSVKTYLTRHGVPPPYIRYIGLGSSQPIADNATEAGRARNRRVEFRLMKRDWNAVY